MTPIRDQILSQMRLHFGSLPGDQLSNVVASHPGCEDQGAVNAEIAKLITEKVIRHEDGMLVLDEEAVDLARYFKAADAYKAQMQRRRTLRGRAGALLARAAAVPVRWLVALWHRAWGGLLLLAASPFLALVLCA